MIALGLDPSLAGFGWAVLLADPVGPGSKLEACGVWPTKKGTVPGQSVTADNAIRFDFLATSLVELADQQLARGLGPVLICNESLPGMLNQATATKIAQGRSLGLVDMLAASRRLERVQVSPFQVKTIANLGGGRRKVEKAEVLEAVISLYPNARELVPGGKGGLNASDAIAIAHIGLAEHRFRSQLRISGGRW